MLNTVYRFAHQFKAPVWRMAIDESTGILTLEIRSEQLKRVSFAAVDLNTGTLLFENATTDEPWHTGIETAAQGVLLIHGYQNTGSPVHKGITALDERTAQPLWFNYNIAFDTLTQAGLVFNDLLFSPTRKLLMDARTGKVIERLTYMPDSTALSFIKVPELYPAALLPQSLLVHKEIEGLVHYYVYTTFRIVSLHVRNGQSFNQYLYIVNQHGEIMYEDLLNHDIQKLQPEAFILHKNRLIYLKNKNELIVFEF